jgi:hypothetical protein
MSGEDQAASSGWIPRPDPTALTTEQLVRAVSAERDYVDGQVSLVAEKLAALDRLVQSQIGDRDRSQTVQAQQTNDTIERVNVRLGFLVDAQNQMMPRAEAKLLIDALGSRIETLQKGVGDLGQIIASLRSSLSGQSSGERSATERADRNRTLVFAVLAISVAIVGAMSGLLLRFS